MPAPAFTIYGGRADVMNPGLIAGQSSRVRSSPRCRTGHGAEMGTRHKEAGRRFTPPAPTGRRSGYRRPCPEKGERPRGVTGAVARRFSFKTGRSIRFRLSFCSISPEPDHLGQTMDNPILRPRVFKAAGQSVGDTEPALDLRQQQDASIRGQATAIDRAFTGLPQTGDSPGSGSVGSTSAGMALGNSRFGFDT